MTKAQKLFRMMIAVMFIMGAAAMTQAAEVVKIDINKASVDELRVLDGIGKKKAEAIIKYRTENNGFKSIEELTKVSGIGEKTFMANKDRLTISQKAPQVSSKKVSPPVKKAGGKQ